MRTCPRTAQGFSPTPVTTPRRPCEEKLGGKPDSDIAEMCKIEQRALITLDTGFGDIRRYPPGEYHGLVVVRLARQDKPNVFAVLGRLLDKFTREPLAGRLWIVEEHRIRIRPG